MAIPFGFYNLKCNFSIQNSEFRIQNSELKNHPLITNH